MVTPQANPQDEPSRPQAQLTSYGSVQIKPKELARTKGYKYHQKMKVGEIMTDSLNLIHRYIMDEDQPIADRAEVAAKFAVKAIPEAHMNLDVKMELSADERKEMLANLKLALMSTPSLLEDMGNVIGEGARGQV